MKSAPSVYELGLDTLGSMFSHYWQLYLVFIGIAIVLTAISILTAYTADNLSAFLPLTTIFLMLASMGFAAWMYSVFSMEWAQQVAICEDGSSRFDCPDSDLPGSWFVITLMMNAIICFLVCLLPVCLCSVVAYMVEQCGKDAAKKTASPDQETLHSANGPRESPLSKA
jgi:hypothetical protein